MDSITTNADLIAQLITIHGVGLSFDQSHWIAHVSIAGCEPFTVVIQNDNMLTTLEAACNILTHANEHANENRQRE